MGAPTRILHLDDNPVDAQLVALALEIEKEKFPTVLSYVRTREEYLSALGRKDFDIILSDYRMLGYDGDQALADAREKCPEIPFIMVTGELGEELVIETLKRGATDYVLKDRMFRLIPAISRALGEAKNERKRRLVEKDLRESEERFRQVVLNIHDALLVDDVAGRVVFANEKFLDLFGFVGEDLATIRLEDYVAPEYQQQLRERHERRMRGERVPTQFEYRGIRKDGTSLWLDVTVVPLFENGIITGTQSTIRNVTERHEAEAARTRLLQEMRETEKALRESEERYRAALASHHVILAQTDAEGRYTWIHDPALGLNPSAVIGKLDSELSTSAQARQLEEVKRRVIGTGSPFRGEVEIVRLDGLRYYEMILEPRRDETGKVIGLTAAGLDITERKQAEQSLRDSRETLALAVKATNLGLFDYYPQSGIMLWNDIAKEHFGLPSEAHIDTDIFLEGIHPGDRDRVREYMRVALRPGGDGTYYAEYRTIGIQDKKERSVVARGQIYYDASGTAIRLIGARSDVTAQKQAEDALRSHEASMDAFFNASPAILNILDEDLRFVQTDRMTPAYFGLDRPGIVGKSLRDLMPKFANDFLAPIARRVIETGKPELNVEIAGPVPGKRGQRGYWQAAFFPVPLPGHHMGLGAMGIDITELKAAQREIQRLQEEYCLLVEQQSDIVAKVSRDGQLLYVNKRCSEIVGLTEAQMMDSRFLPEVHPDDREIVMEGWGKTFGSPDLSSAFEIRIMTARGWRWLSLRNRAIKDTKGLPTMAIVVARDVSERKHAEEELRRREARFQLLISSSKDAIALVDEHGIVLAVSDSAAEMLAYPPGRMVGMDVHHMIQGGQIEAIGKSLLRLNDNPDTPQYVLLRLQTENKSNRLVELEATAILSNGKIYAYFFRLHPVLLEGD